MGLIWGMGALAAVVVLLLPIGARPGVGVEQPGAGRPGVEQVRARTSQVGGPGAEEPAQPGGSGWGTLLRWREGRRTSADARVLPVLDDVSAGLEAGLPVSRAVSLALGHHPMGGSGHESWLVLSQAAHEGQNLAPAWARVARATRSPALASVARAWRVASLTGAPLSDALRVSATTAREHLRLERAVEAATAGARATTSVLTLLPLAGVVLAAVLGVAPTRLYARPAAWACLGAGAVLLLVGQVLVRKLVARVLQGVR